MENRQLKEDGRGGSIMEEGKVGMTENHDREEDKKEGREWS